MSSFVTINRHGHSVRFSPFDPNQLVVATSQYFCFAGGGTLFFLDLMSNGAIVERTTHQWSDGLFDVAWSEHERNVVVSASGDGSLQLWSTETTDESAHVPKVCYHEHTREVCSFDWSTSPHNRIFVSASWDSSIKLWDPLITASLRTYNAHADLVYATKFSPAMANMFASVSADGFLKLWDVLDQSPKACINAHLDSEVMTCDCSRFDHNLLATGGSDGLIKGWDIRNLSSAVFELYGYSYAVRRIRFSPFDANVIASVSYDFSSRIWNFNECPEAIETINHHSEFNYGLDWNRLVKNQLVDCGWDSLVHVYSPRTLTCE